MKEVIAKLSLKVKLLLVGAMLCTGAYFYASHSDECLQYFCVFSGSCCSFIPHDTIKSMYQNNPWLIEYAIGGMSRKLNYGDFSCMNQAKYALVNCKDEPHKDIFIRCMSETNPRIRAISSDYASCMADERIFMTMLGNLNDQEPMVRIYTADCIAFIAHDDNMRKNCAKFERYAWLFVNNSLSKERDPSVKARQIIALSYIDKTRFVTLSENYISDSEPVIRKAVLKSLKRIKTKESIQLARKLKNDSDREIQKDASNLIIP